MISPSSSRVRLFSPGRDKPRVYRIPRASYDPVAGGKSVQVGGELLVRVFLERGLPRVRILSEEGGFTVSPETARLLSVTLSCVDVELPTLSDLPPSFRPGWGGLRLGLRFGSYFYFMISGALVALVFILLLAASASALGVS